VVVHWTGGERRSARNVYQVLRNRGLSVHFVIDADGRITQMTPLDARAAHAGIANARSVGIEVVNPGPVSSGITPDPRRQVVEAHIHGRRIRYYDFTPEQYAALFELVSWLLDYFNIPKQVSTATTAMPEQDLMRFEGVLGHYQITRNKTDPGPRILDALREHLTGVGITNTVSTTDTTPRRWWVVALVLLVGGAGLYWYFRRGARKRLTA
jgi:N-acetyl-anhydromuramyl-L-alanine amidase AmpD